MKLLTRSRRADTMGGTKGTNTLLFPPSGYQYLRPPLRFETIGNSLQMENSITLKDVYNFCRFQYVYISICWYTRKAESLTLKSRFFWPKPFDNNDRSAALPGDFGWRWFTRSSNITDFENEVVSAFDRENRAFLVATRDWRGVEWNERFLFRVPPLWKRWGWKTLFKIHVVINITSIKLPISFEWIV